MFAVLTFDVQKSGSPNILMYVFADITLHSFMSNQTHGMNYHLYRTMETETHFYDKKV